jgi:FKBP-type peptidyl-prolyl cis-trans isomerase FkpA/FKBP-type peptidyl-prolyl cis-trans isomerase FklB
MPPRFRARAASVAALALCMALPAHAQEVKLRNDSERILYAVGLALASVVEDYNFDPAELHYVMLGLSDGVLDRDPKVDLREMGEKIAAFRQLRMAATEQREARALLAVAAAEKGAIRTEHGLVIRELTAGSGPQPKPGDTVRMHYHGTLRDGTVFDSTRLQRGPETVVLNGSFGCWLDAIPRMRVGGKSKITCPPELAYGTRGAGAKIGPGAALVFEVELLEIVKQP